MGQVFQNGRTNNLGGLRTFNVGMHRDADAAIPVTLEVEKAITCEIEPNIQGGPTRVVLHFNLVLPPFVPEEIDAEAIDDYFGNLESYCHELFENEFKSTMPCRRRPFICWGSSYGLAIGPCGGVAGGQDHGPYIQRP